MLSLFPEHPVMPEGFSYFPDFLSEEEETELIALIINAAPKNMLFHGYEAKRKTVNFGFNWNFENRILSKGRDIPGELMWLVKRVSEKFLTGKEFIAQVLLTEYPPGAVINWHRDAPPFRTVTGISLCNNCSFRFRPYDRTKQGRKNIITLPVARRSVYMMQGVSKTEWEHSTLPLRSARYSITMRTLYQGSFDT